MRKGETAAKPGDFLFVTWDGGGNVPPALALGARLARRGHQVRMLGPRTLATRIEAAGLRFRPYLTVPEFDPSRGRALGDQWDWLAPIFGGWEVASDLLREVELERPDVLVVDCLLENALSAAEATPVPPAALPHALLP